MGHVPYLVEQEYVDMYCYLAETYIKAWEADAKDALKELDFLGGLIIELGLIEEPTGIKAFGSTFYSSGEMFEAFKPENQVIYDPAKMSDQESYDRSSFQGKYYIFQGLPQLVSVIEGINRQL